MKIPEDQAGLYFILAVVGSIAIAWFGMRFFEWVGKIRRGKKDRERNERREQ